MIGSKYSNMKMMDILPTQEANASMLTEEETEKVNLSLSGEDTTTITRSGILNTLIQMLRLTMDSKMDRHSTLSTE